MYYYDPKTHTFHNTPVPGQKQQGFFESWFNPPTNPDDYQPSDQSLGDPTGTAFQVQANESLPPRVQPQPAPGSVPDSKETQQNSLAGQDNPEMGGLYRAPQEQVGIASLPADPLSGFADYRKAMEELLGPRSDEASKAFADLISKSQADMEKNRKEDKGLLLAKLGFGMAAAGGQTGNFFDAFAQGANASMPFVSEMRADERQAQQGINNMGLVKAKMQDEFINGNRADVARMWSDYTTQQSAARKEARLALKDQMDYNQQERKLTVDAANGVIKATSESMGLGPSDPRVVSEAVRALRQIYGQQEVDKYLQGQQ